ncbi:hypothetical protein [Roseibium sp. M-1]
MLRLRTSSPRLRAASVVPLLLAATLSLAASPALAQQDLPDCEVAPGTEEGDRGENATDEETSSLSDCDGVLHPAPVGDKELVEPAPDAGRTPVLQPKDVPVQPAQE